MFNVKGKELSDPGKKLKLLSSKILDKSQAIKQPGVQVTGKADFTLEDDTFNDEDTLPTIEINEAGSALNLSQSRVITQDIMLDIDDEEPVTKSAHPRPRPKAKSKPKTKPTKPQIPETLDVTIPDEDETLSEVTDVDMTELGASIGVSECQVDEKSTEATILNDFDELAEEQDNLIDNTGGLLDFDEESENPTDNIMLGFDDEEVENPTDNIMLGFDDDEEVESPTDDIMLGFDDDEDVDIAGAHTEIGEGLAREMGILPPAEEDEVDACQDDEDATLDEFDRLLSSIGTGPDLEAAVKLSALEKTELHILNSPINSIPGAT